jgi:hypothetical protein
VIDETQARRSLIAQLFGANKGQKLDDDTASAYLLGLKRMDTPKLARVVERILEGLESAGSEPYRVPTIGHIWQVSREITFGRVPQAAPAEPSSEPVLDGWDVNANHFLLAFLATAMREHRVGRYVGEARTAILVKWKNAWARDMREDRAVFDGTLDGKAHFADCMRRADDEINALAGQQAAA